MNGSSSSNNEAAEGQKLTKWSKELLMCRKLPPPLFRKSGREIVNAVYIMKALGKSQLILQLKSSILSTQDWFLYWDNTPVHIAASVQEFKWWRRHHDCLAPVLFAGFRISKRFTLPKGEFRAG
jgi:hypothetical protein